MDNKEGEPVFDTDKLEKQLELANIEVTGEQIVDPNDSGKAKEPAQMKNIPYEKIFNSEGDLANPITKEDPYKNLFLSRRQRRALTRKANKNPKNNKSGIRMVVTRLAKGQFAKTYVEKQKIEDNIVSVINDEGYVVDKKFVKGREVLHYRL